MTDEVKPLVKIKPPPSLTLKVDYTAVIEKQKRKLKRVYNARVKAIKEAHKKNLDEMWKIRHSTPRGDEFYRKHLPIAEEEYKKALARAERWYKRKLSKLEKFAKAKGDKKEDTSKSTEKGTSKSRVKVSTGRKTVTVKPIGLMREEGSEKVTLKKPVLLSKRKKKHKRRRVIFG